MACIINVFDIGTSNLVEPKQALTLLFEAEEITVQELIERRVTEEYRKFKHGAEGAPLIKRSMESLKSKFMADQDIVENLVKDATAAFISNGYFVIVDNKQVSSLSEKLLLIDTMDVEFYKLVPLAGG